MGMYFFFFIIKLIKSNASLPIELVYPPGHASNPKVVAEVSFCKNIIFLILFLKKCTNVIFLLKIILNMFKILKNMCLVGWPILSYKKIS